MKKSAIQKKIKEEMAQKMFGFPVFFSEEDPFLPPNFQLVKSMPREIKIGTQKIEINYFIEFFTDALFSCDRQVTLGSFEYLKCVDFEN